MTSQKTQMLLKGASAVTIGFGLTSALATIPALSGLFGIFVDLALWPFDGSQSLAAPETRLLLAIAGGLMCAFGAMGWLVATRLLTVAPDLARTMILTTTTAWFIVDSTASVLAGAPVNALLNVPFLLMFVLPVLRRADTGHAEAVRTTSGLA